MFPPHPHNHCKYNFSLRPSHSPNLKLKMRNRQTHPNKRAINPALPIPIRHRPKRIQHASDLRSAKEPLSPMEPENHGPAYLVEVLNAGKVALGTSFSGDYADAR